MPGAVPLPPPRLRQGWTGQNCADFDVWLEAGGGGTWWVRAAGLPLPDKRSEGSGKDNRSSETGLANFISQLRAAAAASFSHRCCLHAFCSPAHPPSLPLTCEMNVDILIGGWGKKKRLSGCNTVS